MSTTRAKTKRAEIDEPDMLKAEEVAAIFGVTERVIWKWRSMGKLKAVKKGRRYTRFSRAEVERFKTKEWE
jgi:excisionase family DNA binding protein